jgi:membrane-associated phospholipid phosphatase
VSAPDRWEAVRTELAIFVVGSLVVIAAATPLALWATGPRMAGVLGRVRRAGRPHWPLAAILTAAVGSVAVLALMVPVGELAHRLQRPVDEPAFRWAVRHLDGSRVCVSSGTSTQFPPCTVRGHDPSVPLHLVQHGWWARVNQVATGTGNTSQIRVFMVLAAIGLTVIWRRRAWWLPALVLAATYTVEYFGQTLVKDIVDRGHPPTTLGSFPSGGAARLVLMYGIALLLLVLGLPIRSRRTRAMLLVALALGGWVEGFTRVTLLKHWLTDVPAGLLFGGLLLVVFGTATLLLVDGLDRRRAPADGVVIDLRDGREADAGRREAQRR